MARRKTKKSKPSPRKKTASKPTAKQPTFPSVSPGRRIDIVGIVLVLFGVLTLISLFTQSTGNITGWWIKNLSIAIGWGVYILPLALIIFGLWLLLRNLEHFPSVSAERVVGVGLIFFNLTAWFHLVIDGGYPEAQIGSGGGYIGAFFQLGLVRMLGNGRIRGLGNPWRRFGNHE